MRYTIINMVDHARIFGVYIPYMIYCQIVACSSAVDISFYDELDIPTVVVMIMG